MNINQSQPDDNLPLKHSKQTQSNRFTLLLASLLFTALAGYFLWREIQLHTTHKLIPVCFKHQSCADNLSALEQLVKAKKSLKLLNLSNANLSNADLSNANLEKANLESANLESTNLEKANLANANLAATRDLHVHLENANLEHVNFSYAHLEYSYLIHTNLQGARLSNTHLKNAYLNRANLEGIHLYHADFEQANFHRANLSHTYLYHSNFRRAILYGANIRGAHIIEAQNLTPAQIKSTCNWEKAFYKGHWKINQLQWKVDRIANHIFIQQLKQDLASEPKKPVDCSEW